MNLFKWINELFVGKRDWDSFSDADRKSFSPFMVVRYLSMSEDFLPLVNHMQNYVIEDMPHKAVYQFWCGILPKKKTYLKYIKGCLLYTSPSPRDRTRSRMPSSA